MKRLLGLVLLGWALFAVATVAARGLRALAPGAFEARPALGQLVLKALLVGLAAVAIAWRGGGFAAHGFRGPDGPVSWLRVAGLGALPGVATTLAILLSPAKGMTFLAAYGLVGLVLAVWLVSSVAEEIFVRGWLQTALGSGRAAVWTSALFFASLHLALVGQDVDPWTVGIVVAGTSALGYVTARLRERHASLVPAIVAHVAFNVGGFVAAIFVQIVSVVLTGRPLEP